MWETLHVDHRIVIVDRRSIEERRSWCLLMMVLRLNRYPEEAINVVNHCYKISEAGKASFYSFKSVLIVMTFL